MFTLTPKLILKSSVVQSDENKPKQKRIGREFPANFPRKIERDNGDIYNDGNYLCEQSLREYIKKTCDKIRTPGRGNKVGRGLEKLLNNRNFSKRART